MSSNAAEDFARPTDYLGKSRLMKMYFEARKLLTHLVVLCASFSVAVGCGDDDNAEPSKPPTVDDEDAGSNDGDEDAGGEDTNATEDPDTASETSGPVNTGETSDDANPDASVDTGEGPTTLPDGGVVTIEEPTSDDAGANTTDEPASCVENDEPCFSCPATPEQFLKQCSNSECAPFDNSRLGRYVPGEDLPEP